MSWTCINCPYVHTPFLTCASHSLSLVCSGVAHKSDPEFNTVWKDTFLVYDSLKVPWKIALGNHDYMGIPQAQIDYHYDTTLNSEGLWYCPERNYSFETVIRDDEGLKETATRKNVKKKNEEKKKEGEEEEEKEEITALFYSLDSNGCQGHVQRVWPETKKMLHTYIHDMKATFKASLAHWKVVFAHHPIYTQGASHNIECSCLRAEKFMTKRNGEQPGYNLEAALVEAGVDVYYAGHEHVFQVRLP